MCLAVAWPPGTRSGPPLDTPKAAAREPARAPPWALEETVSMSSGNSHRGFGRRAFSARLIARGGTLIFCRCPGEAVKRQGSRVESRSATASSRVGTGNVARDGHRNLQGTRPRRAGWRAFAGAPLRRPAEIRRAQPDARPSTSRVRHKQSGRCPATGAGRRTDPSGSNRRSSREEKSPSGV